MLTQTIIIIYAALVVQLVVARCPNSCNGHGSCGISNVCTCYPQWDGGAADCSARVCPSGTAWADKAYASDAAHRDAECSNAGICDRATGNCKCFAGYTGNACQRSTCPADCSGHGVCSTIGDVSLYDGPDYDPTIQFAGDGFGPLYSNWDKNSVQLCECDSGYFGADCSLAMCPKGDDPLTINQNYRSIKLRVASTGSYELEGKLGLLFMGTKTILTLSDLNPGLCTEELAFKGMFGNVLCEVEKLNWRVYEFTIIFYSWPTYPKENNLFSHNGNPSRLDFLCDLTYVTSLTSCRFTDIETINIQEYAYCSNRGLCDFSSGKCTCNEGFGGPACANVTDLVFYGSNSLPGSQINVNGDDYTSSAVQINVDKAHAPDFNMIEALAAGQSVFYVRGDGAVSIEKLLTLKGGHTISGGGLFVESGGVTVASAGLNVFNADETHSVLQVSSTNEGDLEAAYSALRVRTVTSTPSQARAIEVLNEGRRRFAVRADGHVIVYNGGATITGGVTVNNLGLSLNGGATTNSGGLRVTAGGVALTGGMTVNTFGIRALSGGIQTYGGASVRSGGMQVVGGITISSGGFIVVNGLSVNTNGIRVTDGMTIYTRGLTVKSWGVTVESGGLVVTTQGLTVTFGGARITGGMTITTGGIAATGGFTVTTGGLIVPVSGLTVTAGGLTVTAGGLSVANGGVTVVNGGVYVTNNGVTVRAAGMTVTGGVTVDSGGLRITQSGLTIAAGGLSVGSGGLTVTTSGLSIVSDGVSVDAGGIKVTAGMTVFTGGIAVADGGTITASGLTVAGGATISTDGLRVTVSGLTVAGSGMHVTDTVTITSGGLIISNGLTVQADGATAISLTVTTVGLRVTTGGLTVADGLLTAATGLTITAGGLTAADGMTINSGGVTVANGGVLVSNGGATLSAGGLTITNGGIRVGDGFTLSSGGLVVTNTGLTVSTGGANIADGVTVGTPGLHVTAGGLTVALGGLYVTLNGMTVADGGLSVDNGGLYVKAGNGIRVTNGVTVDSGGVFVTGGMTVFDTGSTFYNGVTIFGNVRVSQTFTTFTFTPSDRRLKRDIITIDDALAKVNKLNGVYYNWIQDEPSGLQFDTKRHVGVIAQEVQSVIPEVVTSLHEGKYLGVDYASLVPLVIEAVRELDELFQAGKITAEEKARHTEAMFKRLQDDVLSLEMRLAALETEKTDMFNKVRARPRGNATVKQNASSKP